MKIVDGQLLLQKTTAKEREVYFVQAETLRLIKIGVANNAETRLRDLTLSSPDRLVIVGWMKCLDHGRLESDLHGRFKHLRAHGEWFRPGDDLLDFIETYGQSNQPRLQRLRARMSMPTLPRGRPGKVRAELIANVFAKR